MVPLHSGRVGAAFNRLWHAKLQLGEVGAAAAVGRQAVEVDEQREAPFAAAEGLAHVARVEPVVVPVRLKAARGWDRAAAAAEGWPGRRAAEVPLTLAMDHGSAAGLSAD